MYIDNEEREAISAMLVRSKEYGLEEEVIWSFGHALSANDELTLTEAAFQALLEWDV